MESMMSTMSRRRFLEGAASAAGLSALLAACGSSSKGSSVSGGSGGVIKFWDMPWGSAEYNKVGANIIAGYQPPTGLPRATYQVVQWANLSSEFAAGIASGTGPAVSSGAGFQAFQYADEGKIAYADHLIAKMQADGTLDDF